MASFERERIEHFRQRWANDHFQNSCTSLTAQPQSTQSSDRNILGQDAELSEANAPPLASRSSSLFKRFQQRSWRENLRLSPQNRLAPTGAPPPVSNDESMLSSDSSYVINTFTDEEDPRGGTPLMDVPTEKATQLPQKQPLWLSESYTLSWLTFFSLLGTLARMGVEALTRYPNAPVTSRVLWANLGGSFAMGFLVQDRSFFGLPVHLQLSLKAENQDMPDEAKTHSVHLKHKKTLPLYVGLTAGFCSCFTSFASYARDAFLALSNDLPSPSPTTPYQSSGPPPARNGGFSFLALLAILILHPAMSLAALQGGAHFALFLGTSNQRILFPSAVLNILNYAILLVGPGCWLGALFLTLFPPASGPSPVDWRARATIPLLFAPPGCVLRYYLAKWMNRPSMPNFPAGTFAANIFGTLVLGMAWDLQHARSFGASVGRGTVCAVLLGVQEGFCGCLTTVSTWVSEIDGLGWRHGWRYGFVSVGVALAGMVAVMGGMGWTIGFTSPVCG